jgi:hypothetical protein
MIILPLGTIIFFFLIIKINIIKNEIPNLKRKRWTLPNNKYKT